MIKKILRSCILLCLIIICFCSCSSRNGDMDSKSIKITSDYDLLLEETISPNEDYITSDEDLVKYTIRVFQNKDESLIIEATSNSAFSDMNQYTIDYDKPISKEDIAIKWTTLMGNPDATEEDQFAIADVTISSNNEVIIERKINLIKGEMEIIKDVINQNKKKN